MLEEYESKNLIRKYLIARKRIQKLLIKETLNIEQERQVADWIYRLTKKQDEIELKLKYNGVIKYETELKRWRTKDIKIFL